MRSSLLDYRFLLLCLCLTSFPPRRIYVSATLPPTCYWEYENQLASAANDGPCAVVNSTSGAVSCCSSGDTCMGNNICFGVGGSHPHGSGYYLSGCTDIRLTDSSCTSHCVSNGYPDIVYNTTTNLWACCTVTDFNVNCSLPTNETFSAPAPNALTGTFVAHSATASSTTTTTSSSTTSTSSSTFTTTAASATAAEATQTSGASTTSIPLSSDSLPVGAKAGISIAVAIAFLALTGLAIAFFRSRRRSEMLAKGLALQDARAGLHKFGYGYAYGDLSGSSFYSQVPLHEVSDSGIHELPPKPAAVELSATLNPAELGTWDNYYGISYQSPGPPVKKHDTYYHP